MDTRRQAECGKCCEPCLFTVIQEVRQIESARRPEQDEDFDARTADVSCEADLMVEKGGCPEVSYIGLLRIYATKVACVSLA